MVWKTLASPGTGDTQHFSGADINKISNLFMATNDADGVDFASVVKFRSQKLVLRNPANTFSLTVRNPVIATSSKQFMFEEAYDYIIFIDADDSNLVKAKHGKTGIIESSNSNARIVLQWCIDQLAAGGGRILLKRGSYSIDVSLSFGASNGANITSCIKLEGESRESVTLITSVAGLNFLNVYCHLHVDNIFIDGNSTAGRAISASDYSVDVWITNCRFKNFVGSACDLHTPIRGVVIRNCYFDIQAASSGLAQLKIKATQSNSFVIIEGNYFDRSTGEQSEECIHFMGCRDVVVAGNIIKKSAGNTHGAIYIDPTGGNYDNCVITGNTVDNGLILVGDTRDGSTWTNQIRKVVVSKNNVNGGGIYVKGPDSSYASSIKYASVTDNVVKGAYNTGIWLQNLSGPSIVSGNVVHDSNASGASTAGGDNGLIEVVSCSDTEVMGNYLWMNDSGTNASPYALRTASNTTLLFHNNNILNSVGHTIISSNATTTSFRVRNNAGYKTYNSGATAITGNGTLKIFTIAHGLDVTPDHARTFGTDADSNDNHFVSALSATTITITYDNSPATGAHTVYWVAEKLSFT